METDIDDYPIVSVVDLMMLSQKKYDPYILTSKKAYHIAEVIQHYITYRSG